MYRMRKIAQIVLGLGLTFTGITHLGSNRTEFRAQVPTVFKNYADFVVLASGVAEILLGLGLIIAWKFRVQIGWAVALFFVAIFWGNISQFVNGVDAFGLNSDRARATRLLFQPLLVIWALWSTGAWRVWRARRDH
jgi:uncharacterized membrane protein